jgi:hypothetical protein
VYARRRTVKAEPETRFAVLPPCQRHDVDEYAHRSERARHRLCREEQSDRPAEPERSEHGDDGEHADEP